MTEIEKTACCGGHIGQAFRGRVTNQTSWFRHSCWQGRLLGWGLYIWGDRLLWQHRPTHHDHPRNHTSRTPPVHLKSITSLFHEFMHTWSSSALHLVAFLACCNCACAWERMNCTSVNPCLHLIQFRCLTRGFRGGSSGGKGADWEECESPMEGMWHCPALKPLSIGHCKSAPSDCHTSKEGYLQHSSRPTYLAF